MDKRSFTVSICLIMISQLFSHYSLNLELCHRFHLCVFESSLHILRADVTQTKVLNLNFS